MENILTVTDDAICSECGHRVASPEKSLSMEDDQTLCSRCYRHLLVPGYKANQMENLD